MSHYFEAANIGAVADLDVIYSNSFAPRMIKANVSIPVSGQNVNLFEAGVYQVGLEHQLERIFKHGQRTSVQDMFSNIVEFFDSPEVNEIRNNRFRRASRPAYRQIDAHTPEANFFLNVDGKTVLFLSTNDVKAVDVRQMVNEMTNKLARWSDMAKQDRAFSLMFLDSTYRVPSAQGMPLKVQKTAFYFTKLLRLTRSLG